MKKRKLVKALAVLALLWALGLGVTETQFWIAALSLYTLLEW